MRPYSMDLRERALFDSDAGMKVADVAAKRRVSGSWVRLLKQRRRAVHAVRVAIARIGATLVCPPPLQPSPPAHDARRTSGLLTRLRTADQIGSLRGYWSSGVSGYQYFKWQFSHASWISEPAADNAAASFASIAVKTAPVAS